MYLACDLSRKIHWMVNRQAASGRECEYTVLESSRFVRLSGKRPVTNAGGRYWRLCSLSAIGPALENVETCHST